jgi:hypothetical protein
MAIIGVAIEQFEWTGNILIHLPTGAAFRVAEWEDTNWCSNHGVGHGW